jgi:ATP-dependent exoDNAse (exonuclease V) beta subunit
MFKSVQLEYNWRSLKNVVHFNNQLFDFLPFAGQRYAENYWDDGVDSSYSSQMIEEVFAGHDQKVNENSLEGRRGGYVQIDGWLSQSKKKEEQKELHWHLLRQQIRSAIDRGYSKKDICILVRKVSEGTEIAEKLFEWQEMEDNGEKYYNCSSREVLQLSSSLAVQAIIAFFKMVQAPDDKVAVAEWHQAIQELRGEQAEYKSYNLLPDELKEVLEECQTQSLWEISDRVIQFAGLGSHTSQIPFLQHFQDKVLEFMHSEGGHIGEFIEWWEEKGYESAVILPEGQDAIRIITIHKSKGLEFPIVLIPFVNWAVSALTERGASENWIWSKPKTILGEPFDTFPVNFSKSLAQTDFQEEFQDELVQQVIDNLNLLYVATTRAERELYLIAPELKSLDGMDCKTIGDLLFGFAGDKFDFKERDEDLQHYTYETGDLTHPSKEAEEAGELIGLEQYRAAKSIPPLSGKFTRAGLEEQEVEALSRGRALHWVFEHIEKESDASIALDQAIENGIIAEEERNEIGQMISKLFADDEIGPILKSEGELLHERELLLDDGQLLRPDRVVLGTSDTKVIDFKTGEHYSKNERQLRYYMDTLMKMDYENVKGYLLYLDRVELRKVN